MSPISQSRVFQDLERLLIEPFRPDDTDGLRRFIASLDPSYDGQLPAGTASLALVAHEAIALLARNDALPQVLERLVAFHSPPGSRVGQVDMRGVVASQSFPPPSSTSPPPSGATAPPIAIPRALREALKAHRVIPLCGAGVSMSVVERDHSGKRLFPTWAELLERAAVRLEEEQRPNDALAVRAALLKKKPSYLQAAQDARDALVGRLWPDFLREVFDLKRNRAHDDSLNLAREIWNLGSRLVVTTNYDRVLHWTCPARDDLHYWDIEAPAELANLLRNGVDHPTIWHLHGYVGNLANIILTPDGYNQLYPNSVNAEPRYEAARTTLRHHLASSTFLFIGFSFDDAEFVGQVRWVSDTFKGCTGPHYLLTREADRKSIERHLTALPIEIVPFTEFGSPLLSLIRQLASIVAGP